MGKLIVLEGVDGSGKSTQLALLTERLRREGRAFKFVTFPRYAEESSALVRMYLNGEFGASPSGVNAYAASAFFAVDRFASYSTAWGAYYNSGGAVIADRYTTSNAIHQGAKLDSRERREFFRWLYDFEFNLMALPAPTLVLYLDLPADTALRRVRERARDGDIHERDGEYLAACIETGREAAEFYGWRAVNAARPAGEIHAELYEIVCGELL